MIGRSLRAFVRATLPLRLRKRVAICINRLPGDSRYWWTMELLRDMADRDPDGFHRFLWSHHLAYAESYGVAHRFGDDRIHPTRKMLFAELAATLRAQGIEPERDVASVLEVGASLGYLLRHLEVGLFRSADRLFGVDIDARAVAEGQRHLDAEGSRVRLAVADMTELEGIIGPETFDVVLCAGVLMYLRQSEAEAVVRWMLGHTRRVLVLAGLASPEGDNLGLAKSTVRERDGTFIHNLDAAVEAAGGTVLWRRWEGASQVAGNTIYFVIAAPGAVA